MKIVDFQADNAGINKIICQSPQSDNHRRLTRFIKSEMISINEKKINTQQKNCIQRRYNSQWLNVWLLIGHTIEKLHHLAMLIGCFYSRKAEEFH